MADISWVPVQDLYQMAQALGTEQERPELAQGLNDLELIQVMSIVKKYCAKVTPRVSHSRDQLHIWCQQQCQGIAISDLFGESFWFQYSSDATIFALWWQ